MRSSVSVHETRLLVAACLLLAIIGGGCVSAASDARPQALRIVYGLTRQPAGFDPHLHRDPVTAIPLRQVYDTLLYRHPASKDLVAGLARAWSLSADGLVLTMQLREDVVFHDGSKFNAAAVAANLARILAPGNEARADDALLQRYSHSEVVDEHSIRIVLREPWSPLPDALTQPDFAIAGPAALNAWSATRYQFHQVGSGPFRFEEYVPGERLVLRRNPDYAWGPEFYAHPGERAVEFIEFRFLDDPAARAQALAQAEVQLMSGLQPRELRALDSAGDLRAVPVNVPGQPLQFLMNTRRFPTNARALRQALLFGTDRDAIANETGRRIAPVAWGPLAESTLFAYSALRGLYAQDRARSEKLLADLGYRDTDGDGWLEFQGEPLQIDLLVPPGDSLPEVAELLGEQWRVLGIRSKRIPVPTDAALHEAVRRGEYNLVAAGTNGLDPAWLTRYFTTGGSYNWSGFVDEELDGVLNEAFRITEERTRFSLYARAQQIIMEHALVLPLREQVNLVAVADGLEGLAWDASGLVPLLHNLAWHGPSAES